MSGDVVREHLCAFAFLVTVDAGAQCFCWDQSLLGMIGKKQLQII